MVEYFVGFFVVYDFVVVVYKLVVGDGYYGLVGDFEVFLRCIVGVVM